MSSPNSHPSLGGAQIVITQGGHYISADPDTVVATLLGSCVACCLWDPLAGVGGINHMLLADRKYVAELDNLGGINAMELLINGVLKRGGQRSRLQAKAFGGANMLQGSFDIGARNAEFTLAFLKREGIACQSHSLGGESARHIRFWPASGTVQQKITKTAVEPPVTAPAAQGNGVDLF